MIEVDRLSESGWHRRNPEKVGTPADPDYDVLRGKGKPVKRLLLIARYDWSSI